MRKADAPLPGWYPDPVGGVRLRWWDGTDWTNRHRSRPSLGELALAEFGAEQEKRASAAVGARAAAASVPGLPAGSLLDSDRLIAEVRHVARSEVDRAADLFSRRAERVTRDIQPLVTRYTSQLLRWLRIIAVVVLVAAIGWLVFEVVVQASVANWLGDRIDNLSD